MPLGTLQSFADNLRPGLDSLGEMIAQMQARKVATANVNTAMADQGGGQPPADPADPAGFPPQVAAGLAALAGGGGAPQSSPGQPPQSPGQPQQSPGQPHAIPTGPVPAGASFAQAFGQQAPQQAPQQQAPQQAPQQQPPVPGLSSTAQPDAAGMDDPVKAGQQSLGYLIRSTKAANPGISNSTLMAAVRQQIDDIKGVAPLTKAAMSAQLGMLNYQLKRDTLQQRITSEEQRWQIARQNANTREERNQIDEAHFAKVDANTAAAIGERRDAAAGHDATTIAATRMRDKAMQDRANTAATAALDREIARATGAERRALIAAKAKVASALLGSFKPDAQVGGVGDEADSIMGDGSPAGGGRAPAPVGGQNFAAQGGKKAPDGHWYKPNTGPDKKTHPYLRLD